MSAVTVEARRCEQCNAKLRAGNKDALCAPCTGELSRADRPGSMLAEAIRECIEAEILQPSEIALAISKRPKEWLSFALLENPAHLIALLAREFLCISRNSGSAHGGRPTRTPGGHVAIQAFADAPEQRYVPSVGLLVLDQMTAAQCRESASWYRSQIRTLQQRARELDGLAKQIEEAGVQTVGDLKEAA